MGDWVTEIVSKRNSKGQRLVWKETKMEFIPEVWDEIKSYLRKDPIEHLVNTASFDVIRWVLGHGCGKSIRNIRSSRIPIHERRATALNVIMNHHYHQKSLIDLFCTEPLPLEKQPVNWEHHTRGTMVRWKQSGYGKAYEYGRIEIIGEKSITVEPYAHTMESDRTGFHAKYAHIRIKLLHKLDEPPKRFYKPLDISNINVNETLETFDLWYEGVYRVLNPL